MSAMTRARRWPVVFGAVLIQLCLGAIYAWSVFTPALKAAARMGRLGEALATWAAARPPPVQAPDDPAMCLRPTSIRTRGAIVASTTASPPRRPSGRPTTSEIRSLCARCRCPDPLS